MPTQYTYKQQKKVPLTLIGRHDSKRADHVRGRTKAKHAELKRRIVPSKLYWSFEVSGFGNRRTATGQFTDQAPELLHERTA